MRLAASPRPRRSTPVSLTVVCLLAGAGASASVLPEARRFMRLSIDDGLSHTYVHSIVQDRQGFLWIGTQQGGLNRYDGHEVKVYRHDEQDPRSLVHNYVSVLYEDRAGTLWVGTNGGGLDRYDREKDAFVHHRHHPRDPATLPHDLVKVLLEDRAGTLWVGTENGLARFDRRAGTFRTYTSVPGDPRTLSGERVGSILEERTTGLLWLSIVGVGVDVFDPAQGAVVAHYENDPADPRSLSCDTTRGMMQDRAGHIWIATRIGLNRFDVKTRTFQRFRHEDRDPGSVADDSMWKVLQDRDGRVWVPTAAGLDLLDPATGRFVHHRHDPGDPTSLSDDRVTTLYEDRTGALWVGTVGGGLNRLSAEPDSFVTYRRQPGNPASLSHNSVQALLVDRRGEAWVGTAGGLNRFDGRAFVRYLHDAKDPRSLRSNNVLALAEDARGTLWVGTGGGGLCRFDDPGFTCYGQQPDREPPAPHTVGRDFVGTLHAGRQYLWIAARGLGLDRFDGRTFVHYPADPGRPGALPVRDVLSILEDADTGAVWLGTTDMGLVRFDPVREVFETYMLDPEHPHSEAGNRVNHLGLARDGGLWLAAESGLLRFDRTTRTFTRRYATRDGLPADSVVSVAADDGGRLWLGTSAGLARFDLRERTFHVYGGSDGLQSSQFAWRASAKGPDGRLYLGGVDGFSVFHPDRLAHNPHVPPVVLTGFELFRRPVTVGGRDSPLRQSIHTAQELTLRHDQSMFSIKFAALNYASPQKNRYAYKMEGFDADWIETGSLNRYATYTNLDAGNYVFRVRGSNNDGVWNEAGRSLRITISPAWWGTWWFRVSAGLAAVALLAAAYRVRVRTLEERERRFRTLAESAPDIVARFDRDLRCRYVNRAVEDLGFRPGDMIGRPVKELGLPAEDAARWEAVLRQVFDHGQPVVYEARFESPAGARFFESRLVPEGTGGQVRSVVSISRDITARKQSEDDMRASLDEKVILLKEIHHRVKNNLQVMSSLLNLQAGSTADPDARERLRESQGRIRIMALIHEKLYESRDLAGADAVDYLRKLVTSAFYAYDGDADRIRAHVDGDEIQLDADAALPLGLIVNELVTNAMKHAFPGGRSGTIEVELRRNGAGTLLLKVADDGVGMPAGFESGGTLGLQLVDALVGQLDGTFSVSRELGTRVDIRLSIPRYKQRF